MTATPKKVPVDHATFYTVSSNGRNDQRILEVMFNPATLTYTIANQLEDQGGGRQQQVKTSTAKLTMDLIFDTTDTGKDVRDVTGLLSGLMGPRDPRSTRPYQPQVVAMDWGSFRFKGIIDQYKETIDFFAPEGVPLRCTVNLSLTSQERVFAEDTETAEAAHTAKEASLVLVGEGEDVADIADQAGEDPRAAAADNGVENPRRPGTGALALGGPVPLSPPTAFATGGASAAGAAGAGFGAAAGAGFGASAGAGFGASAGAGFGASADAGFGASAGAGFGASAGAGFGASAGAGFGASAGASFGASAGASFGASASAAFGASAVAGGGVAFGASAVAGGGVAFGAVSAASVGGVGVAVVGGSVTVHVTSRGVGAIGSSSSAGVAAIEGAFAGLRASLPRRRVTVDVERVRRSTGAVAVSTSEATSFSVGGRASADGASGLSANVGANATLRIGSGIRFD